MGEEHKIIYGMEFMGIQDGKSSKEVV